MTILFLALWLQMSAQPQTIKYEPTLTCTCTEFENGDADGNSFTNGSSPNCGKPAKGKEYITTCWETKKAADETDGKLPPGTSMLPVAWPEPVDVPAVQVGGHLGFDGCGQSACFDHWVADYTCTDKSRILLTSEDGKKHCIKF